MKNFKVIFFSVALMATSFAISSCGGGANKATDKKGKEYTAAYICPMHCTGSGSDAAGKCPACKMDYVVNKNAKKTDDGHRHDHGSHDGHNHDSHEGHNHDHDSHEGHDHDGHDH